MTYFFCVCLLLLLGFSKATDWGVLGYVVVALALIYAILLTGGYLK